MLTFYGLGLLSEMPLKCDKFSASVGNLHCRLRPNRAPDVAKSAIHPAELHVYRFKRLTSCFGIQFEAE